LITVVVPLTAGTTIDILARLALAAHIDTPSRPDRRRRDRDLSSTLCLGSSVDAVLDADFAKALRGRWATFDRTRAAFASSGKRRAA
jgi:hypothetical protein